MDKLRSAAALEELRIRILAKRNPQQPLISICAGTGCHAYRSEDVADAIKEEIEQQGLTGQVELKVTGCHGFCERGPLMVLYPQKIFYQRVKIEDVPEVVSETIMKGKVLDRLLYTDPNTGERFAKEDDIPFYKRQQRLLFGNNNKIDPSSIEDYLAIGGYAALSKALFHMSPEEIIEEVKRSGLRGRGGGGFPTGSKWESTRRAEGDIKYVICNCDEGDPGAYMDRSLMEGNPHSILEGMIIGAYAIGSSLGYVYVRNEYPLAVNNVTIALKQAEEYGFLGENILGSGFDFRVKVSRGGGAFVCGESTALMASLEGKVGEPRAKYVHTSEKGLYDRPSNLNNVETWANIPLIILKGADWFNRIGTEGSKGTKIFSLVGKVNNTGLVEVPMGMTLREIVYDIGGGIQGGKKFKAVQTGGPSGGVIPESLLDLPVDFDELTRAGSMMGSGGMIVTDERTCMVDLAKYFVGFLQEESCGKCLPCREGLKRMLEILTDITKGKGRQEDIDLLERLCATLRDSSLCALGSTAANPVLTTIRYFREEYEAHIREGRCPAGVCKALITYFIIDEKCPGCGLCVKPCPTEAITFVAKKKPVILNQEKCIKCGTCYDICKMGAVGVK
ncbi:MAG: 4Fe-4S dicluster domain-containing protein [Chloroflexi bacterium]|nr:4Fe-4S dicluster domain-containing protein [Chloroflexota bacterium]